MNKKLDDCVVEVGGINYKISNIEILSSFGELRRKYLNYTKNNFSCCTGWDIKTNKYLIFVDEQIG